MHSIFWGVAHFFGVPPSSNSVPSRLPTVMSASCKADSTFFRILVSGR
ncbi:hypothetical protein CCD82_04485 [Neisseria meningitidis]|nr:hypothetical protein CCD90_04495 [Neisseria meningitidis]QEN66668.1 hypothetical protein CCD89_04480 [Neisseria meningitidis]QEN68820.1 hypothetical protein CCD88_04485 [Neisseria meningitidis]QEN70969.1 hypothetical protein CCD86_04480 [Neisseria meningitidis]QEN73115.1 hypothetical protein CCD85_04490 [Neisseria meningitidis]